MVQYDFYPTHVFSIPETHNSLNENHIQAQTMGDPIFLMNIYIVELVSTCKFLNNANILTATDFSVLKLVKF